MTPRTAFRLSVIVCAHNEARFLPACLHSLLAQTRVPDEIVVVNNASTDETRAVAQQIPYVYVVDEPRKGLVVARDGKLTVREVVDLYGQTGRFDVIAITDHILMKKDLLARAGRIATLGRRAFGVREQDFGDYLADIESEGARALKEYGMLVVPGAEVTQNRIRAKKNAHIIALGVKKYISADQRLPLRGEQRLPQAEASLFVENAGAQR